MDSFTDYSLVSPKLSEYQEKFKVNAREYAQRPTNERQCTDICCLGFFVVSILAFFIYFAISISQVTGNTQLELPPSIQNTFLAGTTMQQISMFAIIVFSCLGAAIVISLLLCGLVFCAADKAVYFMAIMGFVGLLASGIYLVIALGDTISDFSVYFFCVAFVYLIFILGLRQYLVKCAILMKTVSKFVLDNPKILFLVFICLIYCLILVTVWVLGLYSFCILYAEGTISYGGFTASAIFWGFLLIFFNFYFYYTSVFLTSYGLAIWFYQKEDVDAIGTPIKHMARYHFGTITYASLLITFLTIVRFMLFFARCKDFEGIAGLLGTICFYLACLCTGAIEALIQVLNSYSIVICALTGKSFIESAEITAHIAFSDIQAFSTFSLAGHVIRFGAIMSCSSIPTIIAGVLLTSNLTNSYLQIVGILLVMFCSSIIGMVILQVFVESIHTLFTLYRLDTELSQLGHEVTWIEEYGDQLNKGFDEAFVGQIKKKPKPKYKKITTVVVHQNGYTEVYKNKVQVPVQQVSQNQIQ